MTEDMAGPVADALNLLTDETAKVLRGVIRISEDVAVASDKVKAQSDTVIAVADDERQAVEQTAIDLSSAADAMKQIAELAQTCNATAETAMKTTQAALQTVTSTVNGINSTRDTIRETEKRIKRLGERSQEISGVVNLINTIAERTHILAPVSYTHLDVYKRQVCACVVQRRDPRGRGAHVVPEAVFNRWGRTPQATQESDHRVTPASAEHARQEAVPFRTAAARQRRVVVVATAAGGGRCQRGRHAVFAAHGGGARTACIRGGRYGICLLYTSRCV